MTMMEKLKTLEMETHDFRVKYDLGLRPDEAAATIAPEATKSTGVLA